MEILIGLICGVLLSFFFSIGPAFFALIQNSIQHGFKKGVAFVTGVTLSDVAVVLLMLTVLANVDLAALMHNVWVATIGGIAICIFGIHIFRSKAKKSNRKESRLRFAAENATTSWQMMVSGFFLNILNPLIWLYWVTIITFLSSEMELSASDRYIFFIGMLAGVYGAEVLKCRLAAMMQAWFTARRLNLFNKITGGIMIAFSIYLIVSMVLYQTNPKIRAKEDSSQSQSTRIIQTIHNHIPKAIGKLGDSADAVKKDTLRCDSLTVAEGDSLN